MNWKERQDWLKAKYPLTVIMDRYNSTYSGAKFLAFPFGFDEVPIEVDGDDTECAYFWKNYEEPVGKGASAQEAIDDLVAKMQDESEDERIRQWLIEECQKVIDIANPAYDTSKAKKAIAWLEKQKEQKPMDIAPNQFDGITYGMQGHSTEKPAEWSEDDEKMLQDVYVSLYAYQCDIRGDENPDTELLGQIEKEKQWLKSLRPQPKWKPTEEQMNSLNYGIYVLEEEGYDASASEIKELYEQLKKLMED